MQTFNTRQEYAAHMRTIRGTQEEQARFADIARIARECYNKNELIIRLGAITSAECFNYPAFRDFIIAQDRAKIQGQTPAVHMTGNPNSPQDQASFMEEVIEAYYRYENTLDQIINSADKIAARHNIPAAFNFVAFLEDYKNMMERMRDAMDHRIGFECPMDERDIY